MAVPDFVSFALSDLPLPGARGPFALGWQGGVRSVFVVRTRSGVSAFINDCPHVHAPLHMEPDKFLDMTGHYVLCSMHGAQFDPKDGRCVLGPCKGKGLEEVPVVVRDGQVLVGSYTEDS